MMRLPHQLLILILLCLASCGYQLQKPLTISDHRQAIFIDGDRLLVLNLKKQLRNQGIVISNDISNANSRIKLSIVERESRNIALSAEGRDAQSLHRLTVSIEWLSLQKINAAALPLTPIILASTNIYAESIQLKNPDNITAQQSTHDRIQEQLSERIINKILNIIRLNGV